jgi:plastocyanin
MANHFLRITGIAVAVVLLLLGGAAISQGQDPNGAAPPAGSIVTSSGVYEIPSVEIVEIILTDTGALPANITVTVGAQVFWVNNTTETIRVSNRPIANEPLGSQLYLPMVAKPDGQAASADQLAEPRQREQPTMEKWISEPVAPGSRYVQVFSKSDAFVYYTSHLNGVVGAIIVQVDNLPSIVPETTRVLSDTLLTRLIEAAPDTSVLTFTSI